MFDGNMKLEADDIILINPKREYSKAYENAEYTTHEKLDVRVRFYLNNHKLFILTY